MILSEIHVMVLPGTRKENGKTPEYKALRCFPGMNLYSISYLGIGKTEGSTRCKNKVLTENPAKSTEQ